MQLKDKRISPEENTLHNFGQLKDYKLEVGSDYTLNATKISNENNRAFTDPLYSRACTDLFLQVGDSDRCCHRHNEGSPVLGASSIWLQMSLRLRVRYRGLYLSCDVQDLLGLGCQNYHIRVEDHVSIVCCCCHSQSLQANCIASQRFCHLSPDFFYC